ncbi:MAG: shikimate kinase [Eubacterium sp.]|nr:shikimate kinase [Eubacterium sp.]MBR7072249.1 shikimate kinase [Eubacterium sp.]
MNKQNVVLIGMPASGKSTCGVIAAKVLLKNFFDTDLLVQGLEQSRLQELIDTRGTDYFFEAEEKAILSLQLEATVIATGGSVIYSEKAMQHLKSLGKVIYLRMSYEKMLERINDLTTRGIVVKNGTTLLDMYNERIPLYEKYADCIIDCDRNTVEETVEEIIKAIN